MKVLLTGATGFVGRVLCSRLVDSGHWVRAALRNEGPLPQGAAEKTVVGDICGHTDWRPALAGVDSVVHAAGRAHVAGDDLSLAPLFEEVNAIGTGHLAKAASAAGVRRFIYVSTVKVNGEETGARAFSAEDVPCPVGAYAISKWHGEQNALAAASDISPMIVGVVRPPLVYGPGVRANFLRLMRWVDRGVPFPLASVRNRRSLVSVWNLCDLLVHLLTLRELPTHTWMISDGEDLSTPELISRLARAMGRRARLLPFPVRSLEQCAKAVGKGDEVARLCRSLVVNSEPTRRLLRWRPPISVDEGIARTVSWYFSGGVRGAT